MRIAARKHPRLLRHMLQGPLGEIRAKQAYCNYMYAPQAQVGLISCPLYTQMMFVTEVRCA